MKKRLVTGLLAGGIVVATAALQAAGPAQPRTMLVLDASGSMWGQIDGKPKIAIAREAVGAMLDGWKGGELGLMAYGHRRKGDCGDIQVLQPVGAASADAIRRQVASLNPKGMTPISAAVRQAAEQLRFTEQKATVVLVSDGEETCNADPCALGRELEAMGVDFTAHVIGFDIAKGSTAHKQLQCLASSTGGRYLDAGDAGELNAALKTVAAAPAKPAPAPEPKCSQFIEGPEFALDRDTWPTGDTTGTAGSGARLEALDMDKSATARDCKKACDEDKNCTAWMFEAIGSNLRSTPVCFRWDASVALLPPRDAHPGNGMGVKKGVLQIERQAGMACP